MYLRYAANAGPVPVLALFHPNSREGREDLLRTVRTIDYLPRQHLP